MCYIILPITTGPRSTYLHGAISILGSNLMVLTNDGTSCLGASQTLSVGRRAIGVMEATVVKGFVQVRRPSTGMEVVRGGMLNYWYFYFAINILHSCCSYLVTNHRVNRQWWQYYYIFPAGKSSDMDKKWKFQIEILFMELEHSNKPQLSIRHQEIGHVIKWYFFLPGICFEYISQSGALVISTRLGRLSDQKSVAVIRTQDCAFVGTVSDGKTSEKMFIFSMNI